MVAHILFLFLDGVGLGLDDPATNPFVTASIPTITGLIGGRKLLAGLPRLEGERATFIPTDAGLGVEGLPQSATGQAAIVTGRNIPQEIGRPAWARLDPRCTSRCTARPRTSRAAASPIPWARS